MATTHKEERRIEVKLAPADFKHLLDDTWSSLASAGWSELSSRELRVMAELIEAWEKRAG